MGRMENPNLDDTSPNQVNPQQGDLASSGLDDTLVTSTEQKPTEGLDLGKTLPISIDHDVPASAGFEDTIPPPPTYPAQPQSGKVGSAPPAPPVQSPPKGKGCLSIKLIVFLGILGLVVIAVLSATGGYASGIGERKQAESTQVALFVQEQYELGLQDMQNKQYDRARTRFEAIIQQVPGYPGVTERLAEALLQLNITPTPTLGYTPQPTVTPDTRGVEELFNQGKQLLLNGDWNGTLNTMLNLRKADPNYQAVQVDGALYLAYRNRGKDKILKEGKLEGGIYDLTQAEKFGPLDADSKSYLTWSRIYILGASFWQVDWSQAVYYFGQVAPALPNLRDGSNWTATERYRLALIGYAGDLVNRREWCTAMQHYDLALTYGGLDADVQQSYELSKQKCLGDQQPAQTTEPTAEGGVTTEPPPAETTEPPPEATEEPVETAPLP